MLHVGSQGGGAATVVVGAAVVGAAVVGAAVVGAAVVGAAVVGATVVGATVVVDAMTGTVAGGASVAEGTVVNAKVVVAPVAPETTDVRGGSVVDVEELVELVDGPAAVVSGTPVVSLDGAGSSIAVGSGSATSVALSLSLVVLTPPAAGSTLFGPQATRTPRDATPNAYRTRLTLWTIDAWEQPCVLMNRSGRSFTHLRHYLTVANPEIFHNRRRHHSSLATHSPIGCKIRGADNLARDLAK